MDLFKLNKEEYHCFLSSVRKLMDGQKYKKEGVAFVALEQMPEFEESLAHVKIRSYRDVLPSVYGEFCDNYTKVDTVFDERFKEFFAKCVKDNNIKDDLEYTLGSVKEWVYAFFLPTDEEYAKIVKPEENHSTEENMELYAQLLNNDDLNLNIEETVEKSRQRSYS